jgi:hypothetical protein
MENTIEKIQGTNYFVFVITNDSGNRMEIKTFPTERLGEFIPFASNGKEIEESLRVASRVIDPITIKAIKQMKERQDFIDSLGI